METSSDLCVIDPDSDIIGIGVRIAVYILSLASPIVFIFFQSIQLSGSIESFLGITGIALFLTTLIKTALGDFTLFHAICVLHLLGLVGVTIRPRGHYRPTIAHVVMHTTLYSLTASGSLTYFIYVFATAPQFGKHPECNSATTYVLFGVDIPATSDVFRWILVASFGSLLCGLAAWLIFLAGGLCCMACGADSECRFSLDLEQASMGSADSSVLNNTTLLLPAIGRLGACIYMIVMLEHTIQRNRLSVGISEWKFGQILAMMMLLGPAIESVSLLPLARFGFIRR